MKSYQIIGFLLLSAPMLWAGLNTNSSTATMKVYEAGADKLTVYTDVPGHTNSVINGYPSRAKSDVYEIWVRSAATFSAAAGSNVWVQCFANMTYNRGLEMPVMPDFETPTASHAYQKFTKGWTHTYANIEMSTNSPVEVEIRKIGSTLLNSSNVIFKSAVHPAHKASNHSNYLGRVYFTITNPCQVVIDINGQMDDHNAAYPSGTPGGAMSGNPPVHSVAFYANPIMAKPVAGPTNTILTINPSQSTPMTRLVQPDPATYNTLVFAPGIHNIGPNFKVHPGKSYYIPGDAILYGNIGNGGVNQAGFRCSGDRINIYGYGTICGIQVPHFQNQTSDDTTNGIPNPEYPEWNAWTGAKDQGVGIEISSAWDVKITGVTSIDPANFNTKFDGFNGRVNDQSLVSWVKLHSWRVNGDGFGGYSKVEDSFFRTSDDSTYVRDWRRRCTFWKDSNANIFRFINSVSGGIEDCDVIYSRWRDPNGVGSVFAFESNDGAAPQVIELDLTLKNIRFHDKLSNPKHIFDMAPAESFIGFKFENISAYVPKNGKKSRLLGSELAPWYELLMFKNVTFKTSAQGAYDTGTLLTAANFNTYFDTNEFVKYILFDNPRDFTVTLTADPAKGVISKNPNQATHLETTLVTLTATALPGYVFTGWGGLNQDDPTTNSTANPINIRMLGNRSITANFGAASVSDPIFITTPSTGSWVVPAGASNASFYAWGGGGAGGSAYNGDTSSANTQARGGGGAGGGYASATVAVTPGQIIQYTNGAGGVPAGPGFANTSYGAAGGVSVVRLNGTIIVSARGGPGGQNSSVANAVFSGSGGIAPASGNIGSTVFYGGNGTTANSTGSGGGGGSAGALGDGGDAPSPTAGGIAGLGGGAAGGAGYNFTAPGEPGGAPGAGGAGAAVRTTAYTHKTGGQGGDGKIIFTYNNLPVFFTLSTVAANGTIVLDPPGGTYLTGTTVGLEAVPAPDYQFIGWSGAVSGTNNPTTVLMNSNRTVTANFIKMQSEFRVNCGGPTYTAQDGSVYVSNNIASAFTTSQPIANTEDDTLYQSETFGSSLNYTFPLPNGNYEVTLMFAEIAKNGTNQRLFNVSIEGTQVITNLDIWAKVGKNAAYNTTNYVTVSDGQLDLAFARTVDNAKISAIRVIPTHVVLATSATNGSVILTPPGGVYDYGATVTVTVVPDSGYQFTGWSGDLTGFVNPTNITMNGSKSVTANFALLTYTLTTSATNGSITLDPPGGVYTNGTVVTVTANPNSGYVFSNWSGAISGSANPSLITMDANKSVTANFSVSPPGIKNALFVVSASAPNAGETFLANRLTTNFNLTVQFYNATNMPNDTAMTNAANKALILISSTIVSGDLVAWARRFMTNNLTVPVINWEGGNADDWGFSATAGGANATQTLLITNALNGLTAGLPNGISTVYSAVGNDGQQFTGPTPGLILAAVNSTTSSARIAGMPVGLTIANFSGLGVTATNASRKVFLGLLGNTQGENLNTNGLALFDAAVSWAIGQAIPNWSQPPILQGGQLRLEWVGGTLQTTTNVAGPWNDVINAPNPYTQPATNAAQFFRIKQ